MANSRARDPSAVTLDFFFVLWLWRAGAFMCQAPSCLKYKQFHQWTLKRVTWCNWCQELLAGQSQACAWHKGSMGGVLIRHSPGENEVQGEKKAGFSPLRAGDVWTDTSAKAAGSRGCFQHCSVTLSAWQAAWWTGSCSQHHFISRALSIQALGWVCWSQENRAQRDQERSPPLPPPPSDVTAYAASTRSERTVLKHLVRMVGHQIWSSPVAMLLTRIWRREEIFLNHELSNFQHNVHKIQIQRVIRYEDTWTSCRYRNVLFLH